MTTMDHARPKQAFSASRSIAGARALAGLLAGLLASLVLAPAFAADEPNAPAGGDRPWTVVGRMGIVLYVIVPSERAGDRGFYDEIVAGECATIPRCFMRFFTNSAGAPVELPLPDAIQHEATALYQRSDKRGGEDFRWACRMRISTTDCF